MLFIALTGTVSIAWMFTCVNKLLLKLLEQMYIYNIELYVPFRLSAHKLLSHLSHIFLQFKARVYEETPISESVWTKTINTMPFQHWVSLLLKKRFSLLGVYYIKVPGMSVTPLVAL